MPLNSSTLRSFALAAAAFAVGGCTEHAANARTIVAEIKANEVQWNEDYKAKDADRIADHYAADADLFVPGQQKGHGVAEIKKILQSVVNDPALNLAFTSDRVEVAASGDVAFASGHYRQTETDPNTKQIVVETGGYVTVYRRQADGGWKAVADINVADGPAVPVK